jgi:chitinase
MGYWEDFNNGATCLTIAQVPTTYNIIAVAFANATTTAGAVDFSIDSGLASCISGGYTAAQFTADIVTAHSRGQKVIISVGGANGAISVTDSTSASNFANSVHQLMSTWGFDGVDIDLENGVNPTVMASALEQLSGMNPGLIITMAPQTVDVQSTGSDYLALALNISNILTIMNTQYYNSGTMNGCDGNVYAEATENFFTALACIQLQSNLRPDQIGLGAPASASAAGSGVVAPSVVVSSLDCLASGSNCGTFVPPAKWPTIRGAMTWSINWDASNGFGFANTVSSGLRSLP